jgi:hypothetical protein
MRNPWMSLWLSAANAWAGAARGFWTAEMRQAQTAAINETARQAMRFWTAASVLPSSGAKARSRQRGGRTGGRGSGDPRG